MANNAEQLAKNKLEYEGKGFVSNNYGTFTVINYVNKNNILIKFNQTGYEIRVSLSQIKTGSIKDRMFPKVIGVGVVGDSITKVNGENTKEYRLWRGVLERCYNPKKHLKSPTYVGCTVSDSFKHFHLFVNWCNNQIGFNSLDEEGRCFHLDKDILVKGNKLYSEDTCSFVPAEINTLFCKANKTRGRYPIGVYYDKSRDNFQAYVRVKGKRKSLGRYNTIEEAFLAYKQAKEAYIKELANKWKDVIDPRVYEALINYQVEITD